jgi:hypothetical protein
MGCPGGAGDEGAFDAGVIHGGFQAIADGPQDLPDRRVFLLCWD